MEGAGRAAQGCSGSGEVQCSAGRRVPRSGSAGPSVYDPHEGCGGASAVAAPDGPPIPVLTSDRVRYVQCVRSRLNDGVMAVDALSCRGGDKHPSQAMTAAAAAPAALEDPPTHPLCLQMALKLR